MPNPAPRVARLNAAPRYQAFHETVPGRFNPGYVARKEPSEIVPAYWGVELTRPAMDVPVVKRRSALKFSFLLLGLNSLFWILWMLRTTSLLALRGRIER